MTIEHNRKRKEKKSQTDTQTATKPKMEKKRYIARTAAGRLLER